MKILEELRKDYNLSFRDLERYVDISFTTLCDIETERKKPTFEHIYRLAKFYRCSMKLLMGESDYYITVYSSDGVPYAITHREYQTYKTRDNVHIRKSDGMFSRIVFGKSSNELTRKHKGDLNKILENISVEDANLLVSLYLEEKGGF